MTAKHEMVRSRSLQNKFTTFWKSSVQNGGIEVKYEEKEGTVTKILKIME